MLSLYRGLKNRRNKQLRSALVLQISGLSSIVTVGDAVWGKHVSKASVWFPFLNCTFTVTGLEMVEDIQLLML